MNDEDLEFLEGNQAISDYLASKVINVDDNNTIYQHNEIIYWRRNECILDLNFTISTAAYGGTKYSGRKLFESSFILGQWLRNQCNLGNDLLFKDKEVIEIGCGSTGIPGMVSLACGVSHVYFCDIDPQALAELSSNLENNLSILVKSRESLGISSSSQPLYSFHNEDWDNFNLSSTSPLVLASEIVYDAIDVQSLVKCIDRLISSSGSLIFCQLRHGRGKIEEFFHTITHEPYHYHFQPIPWDRFDDTHSSPSSTSSSPPSSEEELIFGIFTKINEKNVPRIS